MKLKAWRRWLTIAAATFALCRSGEAHSPDTSYARVVVRGDAVEVRLTFDLFTLRKIVEIDADGDHRVTRAELTQASPTIDRFLRGAVGLEIDGRPAALGDALEPVWPADAGDALAEQDWHSAAALIAFPFRKSAPAPHEVSLLFDVFEAFGAGHTVLGSFEAKNGAAEVTFTQNEPDYVFDFAYAEGTKPAAAPEALRGALLRFLRLGIEHIFLGYDHICFLLALIVVSRFGELVKIVTSFTVAHSITLILATLKVVTLPPRWVETAIALTIVYVAAENLWTEHPTHRWRLTFLFGLIHGFGFASVLAQLGLPPAATVRCLLSFNLGVELGQLAIVLLALPLVLLLLDRWSHARAAKATISIAVGLFGFGWFVERAFRLGFMPL